MEYGLDYRIEKAIEQFRNYCEKNGFHLTADDRIGEAEAALMLGYAKESLKNKRLLGNSPAWYRRPGGNSKVTYRLSDIAIWIEEQRVEKGM